jgi:hypothetical protein
MGFDLINLYPLEDLVNELEFITSCSGVISGKNLKDI